MSTESVFNLQGLQLGIQPLLQQQGQFTRLVNVDSEPIGAKRKRPGYTTFLATPDGSVVNSLFSWTQDNGTALTLYRASGSLLYYSIQGTGAWNVCGNGTISPGAHVGYTVLNNTLIIGDGVGSTRHSTDGTSFTNTTLAPIASRFANYQSRAYAIGTAQTLFYSVTNDATNWGVTGTSDSSSIVIPGPGKLLDVVKVADRIMTTKNSGVMHRWDGFSLFDLSTNLGFTSPYSVVSIEDYRIGLNRKGYFGFNGNDPKIISNSIKSQIYNDQATGIQGGTFDNAPAVAYRYNYMCAVGSVTDDLTQEPVQNALQVYNYQLDQWWNYSFGTTPTAMHMYKDVAGNEQMIFGDASGQCYTYGGTATSDNGTPIESVMEFIYHDGTPNLEKKFNMAWFFFNPGCKARVQIAVGNTYVKGKKNWRDLGDVSSGVGEFKFNGDRGRILFIKITDSSITTRFSFYGCAVSYDQIVRK